MPMLLRVLTPGKQACGIACESGALPSMPTTEMDSQIAVRLPRALLEAVEELARLADRTIAAEIRRALRLHVERHRTEHEAR
jgi:hypothetical protein